PVTIGTPDPAAGATPATTVAATTARVEVSTANKPQNDGTSKAPTEVPTTTGVKEKNDPTQKPTTVVVTTLAAIVTTPVAKTDSTQPQATTVTNNTPAKPNTPGNPPPANGVTTPIVPTNVPPKTVNPATESSHGSGVTTRATTVQITTVSVPAKVSEAPGSLPGTSVTVESSKNTDYSLATISTVFQHQNYYNKTLIAILASCGALLIMIVILAVCASHHRKPYNENQQHLTEELHTWENGYHDNPTLEKKVALNGEFNDSWIVPIDNLVEKETH
uniref:Podocalyxin n=1 Tax=Amphiprion percula TaxID=161767 RepID=A0A3P8UBC0_AMPPE